MLFKNPSKNLPKIILQEALVKKHEQPITQQIRKFKIKMKSYFDLVLKQVEMAKKLLILIKIYNKIISNEKLVNELELKIDDECESILSLYNPMAKDLRYTGCV